MAKKAKYSANRYLGSDFCTTKLDRFKLQYEDQEFFFREIL